VRSGEFDMGWLCVVVLRSLGLAKVNRLAPPADVFRANVFPAEQGVEVGEVHPGEIDSDWVYAVIRNRMHVLRAYAMQVVLPVLERERRDGLPASEARVSRKLLIRSPVLLDANARRRLVALLESHPPLKTVYECQEQLRQLWLTINPTKDSLVGTFKTWCARAEASGIDALSNFATGLRGLSPCGRTQEFVHGVGVPPVRPR
jgi:stearoyl-CoA desaturase (Delta-9 desaturase)